MVVRALLSWERISVTEMKNAALRERVISH